MELCFSLSKTRNNPFSLWSVPGGEGLAPPETEKLPKKRVILSGVTTGGVY